MAKKKQDKQQESLSRWARFKKGTHEAIHDNLHQHEPWEQWVDAIVGTLLTLLFTWMALHSSVTGDLFKSLAEIDSPELIDLYSSSSHRTGVPKYSNITIMPIDGCSRQDVTTALEMLSDMETKAIGLDVTFPFFADGDEMLVEAIMSNGNIVMATCPSPTSYFEPILKDEGVTFGSVVLDADTRYDIVRSFTPAHYGESDTLWAFETQLARMAGANVAKFYPYEEPAYILYSNLMMDTVSCKELIAPDADLASLADRLNGQIVLMGDIDNPMDMFRTPVDADMPGVLIHAYALDTLMRGNTISVSPKWLNWLTAFVLCVLFAFLMLYFKWGLDDAEGLALRVTQLLLMVIVVAVPGVWLFHTCHWYFDFTPTFISLAIQALVLDIWVGIVAIGKHLHKIRTAMVVLCLIVAGSAAAQQKNGLYIYSVKGKVLYCSQTENIWRSAVTKQSVSRLDSLDIWERGEVVIIDRSNDNVYRCSTPMKDNILHFIQAARNKANGLLESLAMQLTANATGTNNQARQVVLTGVTTRAEEEDHTHDSIACLAMETAKRFRAGQRVYEKGMEWQMIEEDGLVHFVISNRTANDYCVNILMMNRETGQVSLRIVPSPDVEAKALVLPAGSMMNLDMYRYLPNKSVDYTLFATRTVYTPSAIQTLLKYPEDLECK